MNKKYYTLDERHPEDVIFEVKNFINELQKVQDDYFAKLSRDLKLTKDGESWLFDYIYNSLGDSEDFEHYLSEFNVSYENIVDEHASPN